MPCFRNLAPVRRSRSLIRVIAQLSRQAGSANYVDIALAVERTIDQLIAPLADLAREGKVILWEARDGSRRVSLAKPCPERRRQKLGLVMTATDAGIDLDRIAAPQPPRYYYELEHPRPALASPRKLSREAELAKALCLQCPSWVQGDPPEACRACWHVKTWGMSYCLKFTLEHEHDGGMGGRCQAGD